MASVLVPYDSDQLIRAYGFGAQLSPYWESSHCFPLNFNLHQPEVNGVQVNDLLLLDSISESSWELLPGPVDPCVHVGIAAKIEK